MATTLPRNTGSRAHLRALRSIHNAPRSFVSAWPKSLCRPQARYNSTETVVTLRRPTGGFDEEPITYDTQSGYGFAPIKHGDLVGPEGRFEILRKLGWGYSGTTWLVKDVKEDRKYLALKVLTAGNTSLVSRDVDDPAGIVYDECRIMQRVSEPSSHPGAQYCLKLINQFYLDSAAGRHLCLLTELAGLTLGDVQDMLVTRDGFPSELAKIIVRELCLALDHLHRECRVVHADLKMSNVLITFNDLDTRDLAELLVKFRPPETYPVRRMDDVHVQTIKSQPLPQPGFADVHPAHYHFKITDYRSAQWLDRARPTHVLEPVDLRAPEMILGLPWDEKVDIWTIGCMTYKLLAGRVLFPQISNAHRDTAEEKALSAQCIVLEQDHYPLRMRSEGERGMEFLREDGTLLCIAEGSRLHHNPITTRMKQYKVPIIMDDPETELDEAVSFIKHCTALDPRDRPSAADLLLHPWLRDVPNILAKYDQPLTAPTSILSRLDGARFTPVPQET